MKPVLLVVLCLAAWPVRADLKPATPAKPATKPAETAEADFVRFREDAKGAQLQTAVGTYRNAQGVVVELVGAIHIADPGYYELLNKRFTQCEAVLYEMVGEGLEIVDDADAAAKPAKPQKPAAPGTPETAAAPTTPPKPKPPADPAKQKMAGDLEALLKGFLPKDSTPAKPPAPKPWPNVAPKPAPADQIEAEEAAHQNLAFLHPLYSTLKNTLKLESQMEGIDYSKPNFVHADMTARQFAALQLERNEGFMQIMMRALQTELANPSAQEQGPGLLKLLEILTRPDSATELKRLMGRMFDKVEKIMAGLESEQGSVIVVERNKVALGVMDREIANGRKHMAIFYGAAHLPDMEKRLLANGFQQEKLEWLTAWDLPPEPPPAQKPGIRMPD